MKPKFKINWEATIVAAILIMAGAFGARDGWRYDSEANAQAVINQALPVLPLGYCQLSAAQLAAAIALSACAGGIPSGATTVFLQAETANVRYRDDGVAPTAAVGNIIFFGAGGNVLYAGTLSKLQFILLSGAPLLNVAFYK